MGQFGAGGSVFGATAGAEPGNFHVLLSHVATLELSLGGVPKKKAKGKWPEGARPRGAHERCLVATRRGRARKDVFPLPRADRARLDRVREVLDERRVFRVLGLGARAGGDDERAEQSRADGVERARGLSSRRCPIREVAILRSSFLTPVPDRPDLIPCAHNEPVLVSWSTQLCSSPLPSSSSSSRR